MIDCDVTDLGYQILKNTGLLSRIENKWGEFDSLILYSENRLKDAIEDADNEINRLTAGHKEYWKDVDKNKDKIKIKKSEADRLRQLIQLKKIYNEVGEYYIGDKISPDDITIKSGILTDKVLDEDEINNPQKFGFDSIIKLDDLIGFYCIGRHHEFRDMHRGSHIWRQNGFKTYIFGDMHGDMQIQQTATAPVSENELVFKGRKSFANMFYSFWTEVLFQTMKFAEYTKTKVDLIDNWEEYFKKQRKDRWDGSTEPGEWSQWYHGRFKEEWEHRDKLFEHFNFIGGMQSDGKYQYITTIRGLINKLADQNNPEPRMVIAGEYNKKQQEKLDSSKIDLIELKREEVVQLYKPLIYFHPNDIEHVVKAVTDATFNLGNRDHPSTIAYMFSEYNKLKES